MKKTTKVWIISGYYDYEGSTVLSVYGKKSSAEAELDRIQKHKQRKPEMPPLDADWTEYEAAMTEWNKGLLNGMSDYDGYYIDEKEVLP